MPRQPSPLTPHDIPIPDGTLTHYDTNRVWLSATAPEQLPHGASLDMFEQACALALSAHNQSQPAHPGEISLTISDISDALAMTSIAIATLLDRVNLPALKEPVLDNLAATVASLRQTAEAVHLTSSP